MAAGALELDAGLLLVRAWQALPVRLQDDELAAALVTLGQLVDLRDLRAKVDELLDALAPDVTDADLADAREAAELTLVDVGATTRWEGATDVLTGELARGVLAAKADSLRGADETRTGLQLLMAALTALLGESAGSEAVPGSPALVVVTDVDDLARTADAQPDRVAPTDALRSLFGGTSLLAPSSTAGRPADGSTTGPVQDSPRPSWGSRSRGGVAVGPRTLAALACQSALSRLVLSPLGHPLGSSPAARQLSPRERRALEHRAGYRCPRPAGHGPTERAAAAVSAPGSAAPRGEAYVPYGDACVGMPGCTPGAVQDIVAPPSTRKPREA